MMEIGFSRSLLALRKLSLLDHDDENVSGFAKARNLKFNKARKKEKRIDTCSLLAGIEAKIKFDCL
jgi:hypothetical protein